MKKLPFDIDKVFRRLRVVVQPFAKAALFELQEAGFGTPFEQLAACLISIRTLDEVMLPTAKRLFERARTPAEVAALTVDEIDDLIHASAFHRAKAAQIHAIAVRCVAEFNGELPCVFESLTSFGGVGPKCANLVLGVACGQPKIGVDIHVHRVTNRWGYVQAGTPEETMSALHEKLQKKYWVEINKLLVPFGKHICLRTVPSCSTCPVLDYCRQVGVNRWK